MLHCNVNIDESGVVVYCAASLRVMLCHSGMIDDSPDKGEEPWNFLSMSATGPIDNRSPHKTTV